MVKQPRRLSRDFYNEPREISVLHFDEVHNEMYPEYQIGLRRELVVEENEKIVIGEGEKTGRRFLAIVEILQELPEQVEDQHKSEEVDHAKK